MARERRIGRWVARIATVAAALLLGLAVFLTQTPVGRRLVLREVLRRVEGGIAGTIEVEGITSPGLLRGFTFHGVRIVGEDGRPFLEADSIMAGLSPRPVLRGDLILTRVAIWSPRIRIERLPGQERMNVVAIFAAPPEGDTAPLPADTSATELPDSAGATADTAGAGSGPVPGEAGQGGSTRTIVLRGFQIRDGRLDILLPAPPEGVDRERTLVELGPDGTSLLRRLSFNDIRLDVSEGIVRSPDQEGERFEIEDLSFRGEIRPTPFQVETLKGELVREPNRLLATVEELRLPSSQASGTVEVGWGGTDGVEVSVDGESEGLALRDLRWIEPRLPGAVARGPFQVEMGPGGVLLRFLGTRLALPQGRLQGRGGLLLGSTLGLRDLNLSLVDVDPQVMDPWLPGPFPLRVLASGDLSLTGNPAALGLTADLHLLRPDSSGTTQVRLSGVFSLGDTLGVSDLVATVAPLEWGIFGDFSPAMALRGPGSFRMEADGSLALGITLDAEATHVPAGMAPSRVTARGTLMGSPEDLLVNLRGELSPLSFTTMGRFFPDLPLSGDISGPVALRGHLSDLDVEAELLTSAGPLGFQARFDARNPGDRYSVDSEFQEFLLSSLVPALPEPTRLTGRIVATGRGLTLDSLAGEADLFLRRGEVGALRVDTAALTARVEEGLLHLDDLMAETNVGRMNAKGAFGLAPSSPSGDLTLEVESESLEGLRPFFMGEIPLVLDDLTPFEQGLLTAEGVELDTIPTAEEVAMGGRLHARAELRGGLRAFSGEGTLEVEDLTYRTDYLRGATLTLSGQDLPGDESRIQGLLRTDSLDVRDFSFLGVEVEVDVGKTGGRVRLLASRPGREEYTARGTVTLDSLGKRVDLDEMNIRFDTVRWNLGGPASISWDPEGVRVRDFNLIRPGLGNMRIRADGVVPFRGEGAFDLEVEELRLDRLARLAQMEETLGGVTNLSVHVEGTADDPRIRGRFSGDSLRYGVFSLESVDTDFTYEGERLTGEAWASDGGRQVLTAEGSVPADLRIRPAGSRFPVDTIDMDVAVDSFPAALALVVVDGLEDVQGSLSGRVSLGGTRDEVAPDGTVQLTRGSVFIPALGVQFQEVQTEFTLNPDGTVGVDGSFRSRGTGQVTGTVTLHPLVNPALDLTVEASNLWAVARRDVQAHLSGQVHVLQTYRKPRVEGSLTVEQGVLMVEELARSAEVVDLSDPTLINVVEQETSLRPVVVANQNPFLQNLMLAVDVSLARDSWLRGQDLNVEMGGELQVFWDRLERNLAMVGELQAVRGYYTVLGRQFQVQQGTVSFLGTPGVNPNLDIEALHRLRTVDPEPEQLEIIANVGGTLLSPRVTLSSNARYGIAESDLVSYLIFGRPSYALASSQNRVAQGAAKNLLGSAGGAGLNIITGTVGSQLGSVVAREWGLDYLAITQGEYADPLAANSNWYGTVATTQVEIGQYLTEDVFAVLMWRPLSYVGATDRTQFAGLRLEWQVADLWTLEGFVEDRFLRSPLFTAGIGGAASKKIKGFSFWREWGY